MKDIPHHIKKLNHRILRSIQKEKELDEQYEEKLPSPPNCARSKKEEKKLKKIAARKAKEARAPKHLSLEERNKKMKKRVPIFDRNNNKKRRASLKRKHLSRKKTPRI